MGQDIRRGFLRLGIPLLTSILVVISSCGKGGPPAGKTQPPAKIENAVKESELTSITLSASAEERLGIEISRVEQRSLPGTLSLGGEILAVPGNEARIAAPAAGTVLKAAASVIPQPGTYVKKGQDILRLMLLPPEKDLIGAREEVAVARIRFDTAQAKADRAEQLLASRAVSQKDYEDAQVELARAKGEFLAAQGKLNMLNGTELDSAAGGLSTLELGSPFDGVLLRVFVTPGQIVPASTILFEVALQNPLWVRVPVYVGDLDKIDLQKEAVVRPFSAGQYPVLIKAKPVQGPPLSDAASASSDLFFEVSNADELFRIGQKVSVSLVQKSSEESLIVPASAVLYDINGGTWVYVRTAPQVYTRRRVEVSHFVGNIAVLRRGLKAGEEAVAAGAAELFGTEFGAGK